MFWFAYKYYTTFKKVKNCMTMHRLSSVRSQERSVSTFTGKPEGPLEIFIYISLKLGKILQDVLGKYILFEKYVHLFRCERSVQNLYLNKSSNIIILKYMRYFYIMVLYLDILHLWVIITFVLIFKQYFNTGDENLKYFI